MNPGVHPRVYGGEWERTEDGRAVLGPSPRVRGRDTADRERQVYARSIPACTAESDQPGHEKRGGGVHPRVYGGEVGPGETEGQVAGPSPRVRGRAGDGRGLNPLHRSIPACTGERTNGEGLLHPWGVHPRVYGGETPWDRARAIPAGPSPRVRGRGLHAGRLGRLPGSIPACTGERAAGGPGGGVAAVHPRVYGGEGSQGVSRPWTRGPSPCVRGRVVDGVGRCQARLDRLGWRNHRRDYGASSGGLIHVRSGSAGGWGGPLAKRSGWRA